MRGLAGKKVMKRRRKENNMIKKTVKRKVNREGKMGRRMTAVGRGDTEKGRWGKHCSGRSAKGKGERRMGKMTEREEEGKRSAKKKVT